MHESRFPRAINEAHEKDMSQRFGNGYVSYRTWLLANEAARIMEARPETDDPLVIPKAA